MPGPNEVLLDVLPGIGAPVPITRDTLLDLILEEDEESDEEDAATRTTRTEQEAVTRIGRFRTDEDIFRQETIRTFVSVPTPEKFLDNFQTGFNTFIANAVQSGALSQRDANLAFENMDSFFGEYIAELGQRAARGEDIFEVTGVDVPEEVLGTRPGQRVDQTTTTEREVTGQETVGATGRATSTEEGEEPATTDTTSQGTTTQDTQTEEERRIREETTEEIVRRPELAPIAKLSPIDFLGERFQTGGALSTAIRTRKGERTRQAQTATGGPSISARRT